MDAQIGDGTGRQILLRGDFNPGTFRYPPHTHCFLKENDLTSPLPSVKLNENK